MADILVVLGVVAILGLISALERICPSLIQCTPIPNSRNGLDVGDDLADHIHRAAGKAETASANTTLGVNDRITTHVGLVSSNPSPNAGHDPIGSFAHSLDNETM
jgi:hypothetical protein